MESRYKTNLRKRLEQLFPGILILKNDSGYMQGIPDWTLLYRDRWAMLEVKDYEGAPEQPNQRWYVENLFRPMSYAAFIYPENEEEVLDEIQSAFGLRRKARVPKR